MTLESLHFSSANTCTSQKEMDSVARRRYQRGSVVLRGKIRPAWIGRWREDLIVNGRVKRIRKSEFLGYKKDVPTMKLALRELEARVAPVNRPDYRPSRSETFNQFSDWWKEAVLPQFKGSSREAFLSQLRVHLVPFFGSFMMKDINYQVIQTFIQKCPRSGKTCQNLIFTLHLMWKSARAGAWVSHDPFEGLTLPKAVPPSPFFYTPEEAKLLIANSKGQLKTLYWIAAETGLRPGELAGLQISNLDFSTGTIHVTHSVWRGELQPPKNTNAVRSLAITPELAAHIQSFLTVWKPNPQNLLFATKAGGPIQPSGIRRYYLAPLCRKLGIVPKGLKAFRHCCATMMDQAGTPFKVRQERLGHSPHSNVTMVHYTHSISADHRSAATALGGMLS